MVKIRKFDEVIVIQIETECTAAHLFYSNSAVIIL